MHFWTTSESVLGVDTSITKTLLVLVFSLFETNLTKEKKDCWISFPFYDKTDIRFQIANLFQMNTKAVKTSTAANISNFV